MTWAKVTAYLYQNGEGFKVNKLPLLRDIIKVSILPIGENSEKLQELRLKRKYSIGKISRVTGHSRSYVLQQLRKFGIEKEISYAWSAPYGWQWLNGSYQPHEQEQAVLREIFQLADAGRGEDAIARILNKKKIPSRFGRRWWDSAVRNILKRRLKMSG